MTITRAIGPTLADMMPCTCHNNEDELEPYCPRHTPLPEEDELIPIACEIHDKDTNNGVRLERRDDQVIVTMFYDGAQRESMPLTVEAVELMLHGFEPMRPQGDQRHMGSKHPGLVLEDAQSRSGTVV